MSLRFALALAVGALLAFAGLSACSRDDGQPEPPASLPADFALTYTWQEGSLPPPGHYEYTITLDHEGHGEIVLVPDYSFNAPPEWRESFSLTPAELDGVYQSLVKRGLFTTDWRSRDDGSAGGAVDSLQAVAGGRTVRVESPVVERQADDWERVAKAINDLVPRETWAKLNGLREQYANEHRR
ncbi:MAG: hypothetical protein U0837_00265 [Dehalococcoidia bacterium]|jgi:hypothetical protein